MKPSCALTSRSGYRWAERVASLAVMTLGLGCLAGCTATDSARVIVRESQSSSRPLYMEGSIGFLRVEAIDTGEVITDGPTTDGPREPGDTAFFDESVEPGEYRLVSYLRPCHGNCSRLDPPTDRCESTVELESGETLTASIVFAESGGCTVRSS